MTCGHCCIVLGLPFEMLEEHFDSFLDAYRVHVTSYTLLRTMTSYHCLVYFVEKVGVFLLNLLLLTDFSSS